MATAQNTGSTLSLPNGTNKTSTSLSTNIILLVNGVAVGAVQSITVAEARAVKFIDEVGTDGHIDSAPMSSTNITGSCQRIRFDGLRIAEAFSRGFIHAAAQAYPFDIVIIDKQKKAQARQISTVIKNVWIKNLSTTYSADNFIITDSMEWEAETIFSFLNSGSGQSAALGGERGIQHFTIPAETLTDTGSRRGSMDTSGLIDLGELGDLF